MLVGKVVGKVFPQKITEEFTFANRTARTAV